MRTLGNWNLTLINLRRVRPCQGKPGGRREPQAQTAQDMRHVPACMCGGRAAPHAGGSRRAPPCHRGAALVWRSNQDQHRAGCGLRRSRVALRGVIICRRARAVESNPLYCNDRNMTDPHAVQSNMVYLPRLMSSLCAGFTARRINADCWGPGFEVSPCPCPIPRLHFHTNPPPARNYDPPSCRTRLPRQEIAELATSRRCRCRAACIVHGNACDTTHLC